jgi:hypothetical protein
VLTVDHEGVVDVAEGVVVDDHREVVETSQNLILLLQVGS